MRRQFAVPGVLYWGDQIRAEEGDPFGKGFRVNAVEPVERPFFNGFVPSETDVPGQK